MFRAAPILLLLLISISTVDGADRLCGRRLPQTMMKMRPNCDRLIDEHVPLPEARQADLRARGFLRCCADSCSHDDLIYMTCLL